MGQAPVGETKDVGFWKKIIGNPNTKVTGLAIIWVLIGFMIVLLVKREVFFFPYLWLGSAYLFLTLPIIGLGLVGLGKKKAGSIFFFIPGVLSIPLGLIAIYAGIVARKSLVTGKGLKKPSKIAMTVWIMVMIFAILAPAGVFAIHMTQPQVYMTDCETPEGTGSVRFKVVVANYAYVRADANKISFEIQVDDAIHKQSWKSGDIGPGDDGSEMLEVYLYPRDHLKAVRLYYDGKLMNEVVFHFYYT